jgi:hypothetical protein
MDAVADRSPDMWDSAAGQQHRNRYQRCEHSTQPHVSNYVRPAATQRSGAILSSVKTTVRKLRQVIREASEKRVTEHEGFKVGDWYSNSRGVVGRLVKLYHRDFGPAHGNVLMASQKFGGHTTDQRFDVWSADKRPATPEEVKRQLSADKAEQARMARTIDTSREGT